MDDDETQEPAQTTEEMLPVPKPFHLPTKQDVRDFIGLDQPSIVERVVDTMEARHQERGSIRAASADRPAPKTAAESDSVLELDLETLQHEADEHARAEQADE